MPQPRPLDKINKILRSYGLREFSYLGCIKRGETEIMGIHEIHDYNKNFFVDITFNVLFPGNKKGKYTLRFNARGNISDGAVIVSIIGDRIALISNYRVTSGQYEWELPRGFNSQPELFKFSADWILPKAGSIKIANVEILKCLKELREEVGELSIQGVKYLGRVAENSGTSVVYPDYFLVNCDFQEISPQELDVSESIRVKLFTPIQIKTMISQGLIRDSHSLVGLYMAFATLKI